ncbi:MAG: ATP-binding protein [bacterium]|nr:ATP-binding protein [bacterium]
MLLTILHYYTDVARPIHHNVFRRLYYLPIIYVSIIYGLRFGLTTSVLVTILYFPHVLLTWGKIPLQMTDAILEMVLFNIVAGVTGTLSDRQQKEHQRRIKTQMELQAADKLKTLGELASGIVHEIRNPLGAMKTAGEIIVNKSAPADVRYEFGKLVVTEVDRLNGIIDAFLRYARPAPPSIQLANFNQIINSTLLLIDKIAKQQQIEIVTRYPNNIPEIPVDSEQMKQVFLNLLMNAVQAMPNGGQLEIITELTNNQWRIYITDTGIGIRAADLEKIFEPFYTTKEGGVGLGLSIAKRIVEEHRGSLQIQSQPGQGTKITIALPINDKNKSIQHSRWVVMEL